MGVRIERGITMHGIALNVSMDLAPFERIVPCGIADKGVTSISRLTGRAVDLETAAAALLEPFREVFSYQ